MDLKAVTLVVDLLTPLPMSNSRKAFLLRFALPSGAAIALFMAALYMLVIPAFERAVMERKREMIRELANVAWSTLERYVREERSGRMTRAAAQEEAIRELRQLRYGPEAKDYYWVIDLHPRMIMHPYVPELEGKDLRGFADAAGKQLFVEQVEATASRGAAYVEYVWQWKDDVHRQTPKLSYVRRFEPWGWIVGTGLYVEDARHEIDALRHSLLRASGGITLLVGALLLYLAFEARRSEARRLAAEQGLLASEARYRTLVRASTEGLLMLQAGHPPLANRHLATLLGRTTEELADLTPDQILVSAEPLPEGQDILTWLERVPGPRERRILRSDGTIMDALLSLSRERLGDGEGLVVTLRDVSGHRAVVEALDRSREWFRDLVERLGLGVFRATWGRRWRLLDANGAALAMLGLERAQLGEIDLASLLRKRPVLQEMQEELEASGAMRERVVEIEKASGGLAALRLSLVRVREGDGGEVLEGLLEDVAPAVREAQQRDRMLEDLQFGQLLMYQSLAPHLSPALLLPLDTPAVRASERMTRAGCNAVVVTSEAGLPCGIVTDTDLRARLLAAALDGTLPLAKIMTAPLVTLPESALVVEGLQVMARRGVSHVAVVDASGHVVGLLEARRLMAAQHALGEGVLQEFREAKDPEQLAEALRRVPPLVRTLREAGVHARHLSRFLTALADAAASSVLAWAQRDLGPAPAPFALVAMGSQGRGEMTLGSDQDQGLIYADGLGAAEQAYFLKLGAQVADSLARAGYPPCPGGVMAGEPAWNASLTQWKRQFSRWVGASEPKDLLDVHICFDLRFVAGDEALVADLLGRVREAVNAQPAFLLHLAQGALQSRATVTKLGAIVTEPGERVDLKHASAKLVNAVRIFALKAGVAAVGTLDRLEALRGQNPRMEEDHPHLVAAFECLLGGRFDAQLAGMGNQLDLRALTEQDKAALKKSLQQVDLLSSRLSFDLLGRG